VSDELKKLIKPFVRLQFLMWAGPFVPTLIYGVILFIMAKTQKFKLEGQMPPGAIYALGTFGVVSLIFGMVMHLWAASDKRIAACLDSVPDDAKLARSVQGRPADEERLMLVAELSKGEKGLLNYAQRSMLHFQFSVPVVHTCAVSGFIVALILDTPLLYIPFGVATAVATLLMPPRLERRIEDFIRQQPLRPEE
jgi:hypothetical protein